VSTKKAIYKTMDDNFLKFDYIDSNESYGHKPLQKDYAVLILNRPYINECYLELSHESVQGQKL
jgi:hypothetical protein